MDYRAIIFDVDGTLIDTEEQVIVSLQHMLFRLKGRLYPREELYFSLGIPGMEALERLGVTDKKEAMTLWMEYMERYSYLERVFPGMEEVIKELDKRGVKLGIITSRMRQRYNVFAEQYSFSKYFIESICAGETENPKPFPDPLEEMARRMGLNKDRMLYVGDSIYDMECAQQAGVGGALALWGAHSPEKIVAEWKLKTPEELLKMCR